MEKISSDLQDQMIKLMRKEDYGILKILNVWLLGKMIMYL